MYKTSLWWLSPWKAESRYYRHRKCRLHFNSYPKSANSPHPTPFILKFRQEGPTWKIGLSELIRQHGATGALISASEFENRSYVTRSNVAIALHFMIQNCCIKRIYLSLRSIPCHAILLLPTHWAPFKKPNRKNILRHLSWYTENRSMQIRLLLKARAGLERRKKVRYPIIPFFFWFLLSSRWPKSDEPLW